MITVKIIFYHRLDVNAIKGNITWVIFPQDFIPCIHVCVWIIVEIYIFFFLELIMLVFKKTTQINKLKSHGGAKGLDGREK